ncbi:MAG: putative aminoacrylate hydrolase RutD [Candidatus Hydrogenedentes bacterium ADurb.Bin170]|nr:MAG: putative aminoacrylate hydrolase RutD [Candidatus Hydrogenedentes bacterium ADurb.Bin170]
MSTFQVLPALPPFWKGVIFVLLFCLLVYMLLLFGFVLLENWLLYSRRSQEMGETPADRGWQYEELFLATSGGKSCGWWIPLEGARGAVLFSHGSGRNISHYLRDAALYRACGFSVMLYDYGGYGKSEGKPSERRCYEDGEAFYRYLIEQIGLSPEKIVLAGASLGSGIAVKLASEQKPGALILEAAFTSFPDALQEGHRAGKFFLPRLLARNRFPSRQRLQSVRCPVLIVHSREDDTIPFAQGEHLYAAAQEPKVFLEIRGSHGGGKFSSGESYSRPLCTFLETHVQ